MDTFFKLLLLFVHFWMLKGEVSPPHIIFIYADDLGWNDVSFHGSPEIPTPNIDALAMSGILLNNYYGYWLCTPSRAALLSGKNPIRLGLQNSALDGGEASGLPLSEMTLPQHLKKFGYANHMVGKWHLGYMTKEYAPTSRGFDSFFGYFNGYIDYYEHTTYSETSLEKFPYFFGIDLQNGTKIDKSFQGRYATELFTEKAVDVIRSHNASTPLFLYFAHLAVHTGNSYMPQQTPPKYVKRVEHIKHVNRRVHAGKMVAVDDSIGDLFEALHAKGMLGNSIIAFISDNGGETIEDGATGSNFPLRGKKWTLWEGGNRVPAVLWSPLFKLREPWISKQLMHVTDWLPTLYTAAGGNIKDLGDIDGYSMWETLMDGSSSPRTEFLYNIDPILGVSALRSGDMKIINGSTGHDSWYNPSMYNCFDGNQTRDGCNFESESTVKTLLEQSGWWICDDPNEWRKEAIVVCKQPPPADGGGCKPDEKPCLFNVTEDPCEYHNLANEYPQIAEDLMKKINEYERTAAPPQKKPSDPRANPECHNFSYVPWLDAEYLSTCEEYL